MEKASKSKDSVIIDLNQQIELLQKQVDSLQKEKSAVQSDKDLYMAK